MFENPTVQLPNTLQLVFEDYFFFFVWVDFRVSLCWQPHPKCERAVRLAYPRFFYKLRSLSNPTNKNLTQPIREKIGTNRARQTQKAQIR